MSEQAPEATMTEQAPPQAPEAPAEQAGPVAVPADRLAVLVERGLVRVKEVDGVARYRTGKKAAALVMAALDAVTAPAETQAPSATEEGSEAT